MSHDANQSKELAKQELSKFEALVSEERKLREKVGAYAHALHARLRPPPLLPPFPLPHPSLWPSHARGVCARVGGRSWRSGVRWCRRSRRSTPTSRSGRRPAARRWPRRRRMLTAREARSTPSPRRT